MSINPISEPSPQMQAGAPHLIIIVGRGGKGQEGTAACLVGRLRHRRRMAAAGADAGVEWHLRPPNPKNPVVFFDVTIGTIPAGRIKMELFVDIAPKTAENFRFLYYTSVFPLQLQLLYFNVCDFVVVLVV